MPEHAGPLLPRADPAGRHPAAGDVLSEAGENVTRCKLCQSPDTIPLPFAIPAGQGTWFRCRACGSDTHTDGYDADLYADMDAYRSGYEKHTQKELQDDCRSNCDW